MIRKASLKKPIRLPLATALLAIGCYVLCTAQTAFGEPAEISLSLMSFNMWGAGANQGLSIDQTVEVLRSADADIIGLQESRAEGDHCIGAECPGAGADRSLAIARALGYFHYLQSQPNEAIWFNAIISRYPIVNALPNDLGVVIDVEGLRLHAFNIHATDYPYQPYQLLGIEYSDAPFLSTEAEAIAAAKAARGGTLELLTQSIATAGRADIEVIFGDFNEPSHRDWSARAAAIGRHPLAVAFPFVASLEQQGFVDTFRAIYPDEIVRPGYTWTPMTAASSPDDHHDRIDYVLVRGANTRITQAAIVGEKSPEADRVITPWPSDHRAAWARVSVVLPARRSGY